MLVRSNCNDRIFEITLADPGKRNALGSAMFASLHERLLVAALACDDRLLSHNERRVGADVVVLRAEGHSFCSGFDLASCVDQPTNLVDLVSELSRAVQSLRELSVPVVAEVRGMALAGGCALLAGCDFVVVAPDAQLGYPVHRIGVSPSVTLPGLMARATPGAVRAVAMSGNLYDGPSAVRHGLATSCAQSAATLTEETNALLAALCKKGPQALRSTKAWLNELEAVHQSRFIDCAHASAAAATGDEFSYLLKSFWSKRKSEGLNS